jgi:hypothetical protein
MQRSGKSDLPALLEDDSSICKIVISKQYVTEDVPLPCIVVNIMELEDDKHSGSGTIQEKSKAKGRQRKVKTETV